jgi:hypothetical protein
LIKYREVTCFLTEKFRARVQDFSSIQKFREHCNEMRSEVVQINT